MLYHTVGFNLLYFVSGESRESSLWNLRLRLIVCLLTCWLIFLFYSLPSLIWPSKYIHLYESWYYIKKIVTQKNESNYIKVFFLSLINVCGIYILYGFEKGQPRFARNGNKGWRNLWQGDRILVLLVGKWMMIPPLDLFLMPTISENLICKFFFS